EVPEVPDAPEVPEVPEVPDAPKVPEDANETQNNQEVSNQATQGTITNDQLIEQQQIVSLPKIVEDFRFWTIAKKYAFAREEMSIVEEMTDSAREIGNLPEKGVCYIIQEEENGWLYVESGTVRGFVKAEQVISGEEADEMVTEMEKEAKEEAKKRKKVYKGITHLLTEAEEIVPAEENLAFLHTRSTVRKTVVDKVYALCTENQTEIHEDKNAGSRVVGMLNQNDLCYILADEDDDYVYVESGNVRGFVNNDALKTDKKEKGKEERDLLAKAIAAASALQSKTEVKSLFSTGIESNEETADAADEWKGKVVTAQVKKAGEESFKTAEELVTPEENHACYYTVTSVKSGVPNGEIRNSVLEFASQFIGNPYVWGGTSLTEGADCSGFVQSIYAQYGYALPRIAEDQAQYGTKISVEDAQPGDLIFYAKNGYIYHVVIYAGDGQTIEAMSKSRGIVQGTVNTANAVWAVRVLEDETQVSGIYGSDIAEVNASILQYGDSLGTFKITHYCSGSCCNDEWAGVTSTGAPLIEGDTIAVDPSVIPYGTKVIINGHIFTAEDCGGAIKGNRIDVFVNDHERANQYGVYNAEVYLLK
ncbi:MAG: NlpC/P60 family protein, partial [Blautia sp.]